MYSIGQFSVMFNVNKKTLRYYDEISLFKPAFVDENNQYRYYGENQIAVMKEIQRLKDIGMPLEQISIALNNQDNTKLIEFYNERLREIEETQKMLEKQKRLILHYKGNEGERNDLRPFLTVEMGHFIEKGSVYYRCVNCEMDEIQKFIGMFYEKAKGISLQGSHIFKMSMEEDTNSVSEIFAYTVERKHEHVRDQERERCLKVTCMEINQRVDGYHTIFEHMKKNHFKLKNIYEKYSMEEGQMKLEIIASILLSSNTLNSESKFENVY
ncbi:MerR family transcriptional regulator [Anaerocolumna sp. MB42-C2]|uniref:MerR family transcriptional regulator n=1 Tax=Anaerocolumna sp. MB42-C2 TaxID=3070997 RepID=UPI0027DF110B|nr:helix-turn-helix domain-containing protein [Anaerocolumna sp. MB42-C2]WMJ86119.1 helix-turn-helix domain-containing protein [Anaerocolumna sp. MB42-C2]